MTDLLILDMDGTVRIKKGGTPGDIKAGFISHPEDQEIIPGAAKAIEVYAKEGWLIVGVSNQGGVAAGKKTMRSCSVEQQNTVKLCPEISRIFFCPDYEGKQLFVAYSSHVRLISYPTHVFYQEGMQFSSFRKPEPGMIEWIKAVEEPDKILFVGDRPEDEQAAEKAGIDFQWAKDWWR